MRFREQIVHFLVVNPMFRPTSHRQKSSHIVVTGGWAAVGISQETNATTLSLIYRRLGQAAQETPPPEILPRPSPPTASTQVNPTNLPKKL